MIERRIQAHKFNRWVDLQWEQVQVGDIVRIYDLYGLLGVYRVLGLCEDRHAGWGLKVEPL